MALYIPEQIMISWKPETPELNRLWWTGVQTRKPDILLTYCRTGCWSCWKNGNLYFASDKESLSEILFFLDTYKG